MELIERVIGLIILLKKYLPVDFIKCLLWSCYIWQVQSLLFIDNLWWIERGDIMMN